MSDDCATCGYDRVDLPADSQCPECGSLEIAQKSTQFHRVRAIRACAIASLILNVLVWIPGILLSFLAWFSKFSDNDAMETALARASGLSPIAGMLLAVFALALVRTHNRKSTRSGLMVQTALSLACVIPFPAYVLLKVTN